MIYFIKNIKLILILSSILFFSACSLAQNNTPPSFHAEIEYLEVVNRGDVDSLTILLLMQQYLNTHQQKRGIAFFESIFKKNKSQLSNSKKAIYLSTLGILRATYADKIFLLKRIGWVNKSIKMLEEAKRITGNNSFVPRWASGVVYAQLPWFFGKKGKAFEELNWVVAHKEKAPVEGFLREVYFHLAKLYDKDGKKKESAKALKLSQYKTLKKDVIMISSWAIEKEKGLTFKPWQFNEVIPNRVYNVSSVEFTEYHFIISDDGQELITIDMGSRPSGAKDAYEYLKKNVPNLPPLTTAIMTHSHGDHIGGYNFFKKINPNLKVIAMHNHHDEWNRFVKAPKKEYLFGTDFKKKHLMDYQVDKNINQQTSLNIGGTTIDLYPIDGGETPDAMFIHLPKYSVLFLGDFIMPMMGDPLLEEGNLEGLFTAIDLAVSLHPKYILHGHEGLNFLYPTVKILEDINEPLQWLYEETLGLIEKGMNRTAIHHLNLIAPSVINHPNIQLQYLINRENLINRTFDKKTGYWQLATLEQVDILDHNEYGILLKKYFKQSERQVIRATKKMLKDGEYDLSFKTLHWALTQYPESSKLKKLYVLTARKLVEKYQFISPFKMSLYGFKGGQEFPQLE